MFPSAFKLCIIAGGASESMLAVADTLALAAVAVALCDDGPARRHCPAHCPLGYLACFVSNIVRSLLLHSGSVDAAVADVLSRWAWQGIAAKARSVHPALFKALLPGHHRPRRLRPPRAHQHGSPWHPSPPPFHDFFGQIGFH